MGFVLTLVYVTVLYLTPAAIVPDLAPYRIQLWIGILALIFSIPGLLKSTNWRLPQLRLFAGLLICIPLSHILGPSHWMGGAVNALMDFLPNGIVLLLVVAHCRSIRKLKILLGIMLSIAAYYVLRGAQAYYGGILDSPFIITQHPDTNPSQLLLRIRALGVLNDPNDFAQLIISLIPFIWLRWRPGNRVSSLFLCGIPTLFFLWGTFLTHSRGSMVAMAVLLLLLFRRKLGPIPAMVVTGAALAGFLAINFAGGRSVSFESGADRLSLWGTGLALFKSSPLFGIGYNQFDVGGQTAHNSVVLCLTELGLIGYFFWIGIIVFTFVHLNGVMRAEKAEETDSIEDAEGHPSRQEELQRFASLARLSLTAFLAAAWFLSRAYVATLWLVLGIGIAVVQIARADDKFVEIAVPRRILGWSAAT